MDQADKFSQLTPVLELVYVMLTNMSKYMDVYAKDIEAEKLDQYAQSKDAISGAIKKFDALYGLKSPASADVDEVSFDQDVEPVSSPVAPTQTDAQPYDFASGSDPESLKKAKQAVDELKTLFADMKKEESAAPMEQVVPQEQSMPTFVPAPAAQDMSSGMPASTETVMPPAPVAPAPAVEIPTPMNTPAPAQDAGEIDSILAELKKLQNKGTTQL